MPANFKEVYDLYQDAQSKGLSIAQQPLSEFAKTLNVATESNAFDTGTNGAIGEAVKKGSYWAEAGLDYTGVPQAVGRGTQRIGEMIGADPEISYEIGKSVPAGVATMLPMILTAPISAPAAAGGLIASSALGAAHTWANTDTAAGAATGALMPFVGTAGVRAASLASSSVLSKAAQAAPILQRLGLTGGTKVAVDGGVATIAKTLPDRIANYVAGNVGAGVASEAVNRGINGSPGYDFFSKESLLANLAPMVPFAIRDARGLMKPTTIKFTPDSTAAPEAARNNVVVDENTLKRAQAEIEAQNQKELAAQNPDTKAAVDDTIKSEVVLEEALTNKLKPADPSEVTLLGVPLVAPDPVTVTPVEVPVEVATPADFAAVAQVAKSNKIEVNDAKLAAEVQHEVEVNGLNSKEAQKKVASKLKAKVEKKIKEKTTPVAKPEIEQAREIIEKIKGLYLPPAQEAEALLAKADELEVANLETTSVAPEPAEVKPTPVSNKGAVARIMQERGVSREEARRIVGQEAKQRGLAAKAEKDALTVNDSNLIKVEEFEPETAQASMNKIIALEEASKQPTPEGKEMKQALDLVAPYVSDPIRAAFPGQIPDQFASTNPQLKSVDQLNVGISGTVDKWRQASIDPNAEFLNKGKIHGLPIEQRLKLLRDALNTYVTKFGLNPEKATTVKSGKEGSKGYASRAEAEAFIAKQPKEEQALYSIKANSGKNQKFYVRKAERVSVNSFADVDAALEVGTDMAKDFVDNTNDYINKPDDGTTAQPVRAQAVDTNKQSVKEMKAEALEKLAESTPEDILKIKALMIQSEAAGRTLPKEIADLLLRREAEIEALLKSGLAKRRADFSKDFDEDVFVDQLDEAATAAGIKFLPKDATLAAHFINVDSPRNQEAIDHFKYMPEKKQLLTDFIQGKTAFKAAFMRGKPAGDEAYSRMIFAGPRAKEVKVSKYIEFINAQKGRNFNELTDSQRDLIWKTTGWIKGPDGKVRFEIDDSKATTILQPDSLVEQIPQGMVAKLSDVLDHPDLFKNYPLLGEIRVRVSEKAPLHGAEIISEADSQGNFDPISSLITLHPKQYDLMGNLLHEVQHAVQEIEGFAFGGTESDLNLIRQIPSERKAILKQKIAESMRETGSLRDPSIFTEAQWDKKILSIYGYDIYHNTLGEIEARSVAERFNATKEYKKAFAHMSNVQINNEFFTINKGLGTSFSLLPDPTSRSKFERHLEMPSFERAFGIGLEAEGVPTEIAGRLANVAKTLLPHLNAEDVRYGRLVDDLKAGGQILGMATVEGPMKKLWLGADEKSKGLPAEVAARNATIRLAHETSHLVEWASKNGMLDADTQEAIQRAEEWFGTSSKEDVQGMLTLMNETMMPKEWHDLHSFKDLLEYVGDPKEAMATAYGIWNLSSVAKEFDTKLLGAVGSQPVRNWLGKIADWSRKIFSGMKTALMASPRQGSKEARARVDGMIENFRKIKKGLNEGQKSLDDLQMLADLDAESFVTLKTSALAISGDSRASSTVREFARFMSRDERKGVLDSVTNQASRWFEFGEQVARRIPAMAESWWAVLEAPTQVTAYMNRVMAPITGEVDSSGKHSPTKRREKMLAEFEKNQGLRDLVSDIKQYQNQKQGFLDGSDPKDKPLLDRINALPTEKRNYVNELMASYKTKNRVEMREILDHKQKVNVITTASILSSFHGDRHKGHLQASELLMHSEVLRMVGDVQGATQALAQADVLIGDPVSMGKAMEHVRATYAARAKLESFLTNRPWFSSEIQTGKWRVKGFDKNGGLVKTVPAETSLDKEHVKRELRKLGAEKFEETEILRGGGVDMDDSFSTILEEVSQNIEQSLMKNLNPLGVPNDQIKNIAKAINLKGQFNQYSQATNMVAPGSRKLSKDADVLDMLATDKRYSKMMASSLVNSLTKARLEFELLNPETKQFPQQIQQIKQGFENYLKPDGEVGKALVKFQAPYYLGLNLSSHFAELFQGIHTIMPEAVRETRSISKASSTFMGVLKDLGNYYMARPLKGSKDAWDSWKNVGERKALEQFAEEGLMSRHAYSDGQDEEGQAGVKNRWRATRSKPVSFVKSVAKSYSDVTMGIYESFTRFNARTAGLMGYRMAIAQGLSHEQAVEKGRRFLTTTTFSSGRAGRPVSPFSGSDNSLGMAAYSLQRYSLSWMAMFGRQLQHSFTSEPGKLGLQPGDQAAARKTATMMALTQFASAGALGLPFVGAMSTILEKMTGESLKSKVYEAFGEMMDQDDEEGGVLADVIMRGAANAMLERAGVPIDLASKFALGGTPGFSEMQGFDSGSIFGPTASLVKSVARGVTSLAKDGDIKEFARQAFPPGWRKAIDIAANGDATTKEGSRLGLDDWEKNLYAIGFTPDKVRKLRDFERMNDSNNIKRRRQEARQNADIVAMLEEDPQAAMQRAAELVQASDGSLTMREVASRVAEAAAKKQFPKDVRSEVTAAESGQASNILRGMGLNLGPSQAVERTQYKDRVLSMFGVSNPNAMRRASRIDSTYAGDPWMSSFAEAGAR